MAKKLLTWYLAFVMALLALAPRVDAFFAPTSPSSAAQVSGDERTDRARIEEFLEGRLVRGRLQAIGFTRAEIDERLAGLTGKQLHELASRLEDVKTGGAAEGILIGLLIIVLFIGVVLPLLGIRIWR